MNRFLTLYFALFVYCLSAQDTFVPGFLLSTDGDRTDVLIKDRTWQQTPVDFQYRSNADAVVRRVTAEEIGGFGVEKGPTFYSRTVDFDLSVTRPTSALSNTPEPIFETRTVFLRPLLRGDLTLYVYKNTKYERFFLQLLDGPIVPLIYKKYRRKGKVEENNAFRRTLQQDYPTEAYGYSELSELRYREKDLVAYFSAYARAQSLSTTPVDYQKPKVRTTLSGGIGVQKFVLPNRYDFSVLTVDPGTGQAIIEDRSVFTDAPPEGFALRPALRLEINLPGDRYAWSILFGLEGSRYRYEEGTDTRYNRTFVGIPIFDFRRYFNLQNPDLRPYLELRTTLNFYLTEERSIKGTTVPGLGHSGGYQAIIGGIRVQQRIFAELEYYIGNAPQYGVEVRYKF